MVGREGASGIGACHVFAFVVRNKSPYLRFVASVVSLRCLCLCLVACLDHSWVSRSLESDLVYVRRVLAILSVSPVFGLRQYCSAYALRKKNVPKFLFFLS